MATYSTGIAATWASTTFAEIVDLAVTYGGSLPKGRGIVWSDDVGEVSLTCLSSTGMSTANYGVRGTLALSGGGVSLTHDAIYQSVSVAPQLNGITRFTVTFKLLA